MTGTDWLRLVEAAVQARIPDVEVTRADEATMSVSRGLRVVVAHVVGDVAIIAPSFAAGGSIASRLESRVQHLDVQSYGLSETAADAAADAVIAHLRSNLG
jgi:hypothetical protein